MMNMHRLLIALALVIPACGPGDNGDDDGDVDAQPIDATQSADPSGRWLVESMACTSGQPDCATPWAGVAHVDVAVTSESIATLTWSNGATHAGTWAGRCVTLSGDSADGRQRRSYDWCRDAADLGLARTEVAWSRADGGVDRWAIVMRRP